MARENPTSDRRRIRSELALLGYHVAELTAARYMYWRSPRPSPAWRAAHIRELYHFKVLLEPDETGLYVATRPSVPGCYSQGDTIDAVLDNAREVIELCLEDVG